MRTIVESIWAGRGRGAALGLAAALLFSAVGGTACRGGTGTTAAATPPGDDWYVAGSALTDDAGTLSFTEREESENLVEEGLTYLRVTNGPCDGSPAEFYVYEGNLAPPADGDRAWSGELAPVAGQATPLASTPNAPDAYLESSGIMSRLRVTAEGLPPDMAFQVCLRRP